MISSFVNLGTLTSLSFSVPSSYPLHLYPLHECLLYLHLVRAAGGAYNYFLLTQQVAALGLVLKFQLPSSVLSLALLLL